MIEAKDREIVLRPNTRWLHLDIEGLVAYRDLLWLLVRRDFVARYRQTVLGPIWFVINPVITTIMFTLVFNRIIGVPTDGVPPMLFYMSGTLAWNYFSTVLSGTANSLAGNTHLFAKVYFPRLIPPLATSVSAASSLVVQFIIFLLFFIQDRVSGAPSPVVSAGLHWLLLPVVMLHTAALSLGLGLILSSLTAKYRDLAHVQGYFVSLLMYATPVIYPLSRIPEKYQWIAMLNPMTAVVESTRHILLGVGTVNPAQYATSALVSLFILAAGIFAYQRAARTFVDTV